MAGTQKKREKCEKRSRRKLKEVGKDRKRRRGTLSRGRKAIEVQSRCDSVGYRKTVNEMCLRLGTDSEVYGIKETSGISRKR